MNTTENYQSTLTTYRVEFNQPTFDLPRTGMVICDDIPDREMAVKTAFNLHAFSNVPHTVCVKHDDLVDVEFIRK